MLPLPRFAWEAPDRLDDALAALAEPGARAIAGGTDLLPSMKHRLFEPATLVSLRRLADLRGIEPLPDGGIAIGAAETLRDVARDARIRDRWPALADACRTVATPTVQAMGTLGGNVLLDTRCVFYNQPLGWRTALGYCLKCPSGSGGAVIEPAAPGGPVVCHVAPRGKGCYAAHSADTIPALWLHGARVEVAGPEGRREIAISDLYTDDGAAWLRVGRGEILTRVLLPAPRRVVHRKLRMRAAIDYATLLVAVARDDAGWHAVISAVGPRPIEVSAPDPASLADAAHAAVQPLPTHLQPAPWRKKMVRVEVRRAAEQL